MNQQEYEEYIEKLNDISDRKALFEKKSALGMTDKELADGYLELAKEYQAIGAMANYHGCMKRHFRYAGMVNGNQPKDNGVKILESVFTGEEFTPEPENELVEPEFDFDWQKYTE